MRDLSGPWLLYDNQTDPHQLDNLCNWAEFHALQGRLDQMLNEKLAQTGDAFLPGEQYLKHWNYQVDETGTIPYTL